MPEIETILAGTLIGAYIGGTALYPRLLRKPTVLPGIITAIRNEVSGDWAAIRAVHTAAFGQAVEADLADALRDGGFTEISIVADRGGMIAGHIMLSRLEAPMRALALAPLAVHPGSQRLGIGAALVREAMAAAAKQAWEAVFVLGNPTYYRGFGFDVEAARIC